MSNVKRIQGLVEKALDDFDDQSVSTAAILRRCIRIATLRNDFANLIWLEFESMDVSVKDTPKELGPRLLLHVDKAEADRLLREALRTYMARRAMEGGNINPRSVEQLEMHILRTRNAESAIEVPQGLHPVDLYHRSSEATKAKIDLQISSRPIEDMLSRIRARLHDFLVGTERQLEYGQVNANIFERTREVVDEQLSKLAPEALEKFTSAYRRVQEGDPEALSQALTSCRRILKATADAIEPPTEDVVIGADGVERKMSDDRYLNRLLHAVEKAIAKHGEGQVLTATIKSLGERLTALDRLASKGVHASVTPEEVDICVVQTYLIVGDVLRVVSGRSGLHVGAE